MEPTLTPLAAVLLLFLAVGVGFIFVHLLAGKFIRPNNPNAEKKTIYECGEPTVGSAWIQFDLRFYVVALLFVIFDVEVAFFFPWAEVFGKAHAVAAYNKPATEDEWTAYGRTVNELIPPTPETQKQRDVNANLATASADRRDREFANNQSSAQQVVVVALLEILVFFGVLLVGFAYLWRRGDLEWVRSTLAERPPPAQQLLTTTTNGAARVAAPVSGALAETAS